MPLGFYDAIINDRGPRTAAAPPGKQHRSLSLSRRERRARAANRRRARAAHTRG